MIGSLGEVGKIPELRQRVFFTIMMLAVYRLGVFVSTPGVNIDALRNMFSQNAGSLFGFINMFSGGAWSHFSIFALGITPYISMSILMQMLSHIVPSLEALKKEGESGQRVITRYTRWGTVALALVQSSFIATGLQKQGLVIVPGMTFIVCTVVTLTAGTAFIMWLGEQITERGIGNGSSIIIFSGIVAHMPEVFVSTLSLSRSGDISPLAILVLIAFSIGTIAAIVYVERSHRKIPIQHPRKVIGQYVAQQQQYLPLKVNIAGVIPPIFASALMVVPGAVASLSPSESVQEILGFIAPGGPAYTAVYAGLIFFFSFIYTGLIFNPVEVAENLKKGGSFIPTVRPGKPTADYLYSVMNRLTLWGAIYLALICVVPQLIYFKLNATAFAYIFGGTAILIVVGVTLDTASQIESHVMSKNYDAFMTKGSGRPKAGLGSMSQMRSRLLRR